MIHRRYLRGGEKGGAGVGKTKRGKGSKIMAVANSAGLPIAISVGSASPHEVTLAEPVLEASFVEERPERLIGDKAYDSDPLRKRLKALKIDLIVPHRNNRKKPKLQDGRKLRRYRRRWEIESTFSCLSNFRRLVVRYERHIKMYRAFFHLACLMIVLNRF